MRMAESWSVTQPTATRLLLQDKQPGVLLPCKSDSIHEMLQIVLPLGDEPSKRSGKDPKRDSDIYPLEGKKVTSQTGEVGIVRRSPDMDSLKTALQVRCCCFGMQPLCTVARPYTLFTWPVKKSIDLTGAATA